MPKFYLTQLVGKFYLVSSPKKENILTILLKTLLSEGLFSITQEPDGSCSLLIEEGFKNKLPEECYFTEPYQCLEITTENPGLNEPGMLAEISEIFAKYKIPILCNSTFYCNYISYPVNSYDNLMKMIKENKELFDLQMDET